MKFVLLAIIIALVVYLLKRRPQKSTALVDTKSMHELLQQHVNFYQRLNSDEQLLFRNRVQHFLDTTTITAVGNFSLTELDQLFVASSAIIPIFSFPDWAYNNLNEVLLYAEMFTKDFDPKERDKNVMGMVGSGAMNRMMILSLPALRAGFEQDGSGNTGIHEFVHLLDKADGATDGVPEYMLPKDLIAPWIKYAHEAIHEIKTNHSEINPYAATNDAEFFAVISEYFFQKPHLLQEHHPELFNILEQVYKPIV
jgi:MtfA peptidase